MKKDTIQLEVFVKETQKRLCKLRMQESDRLSQLRDEIVRVNKRVILKSLYISEEQCIGRIIKLCVG